MQILDGVFDRDDVLGTLCIDSVDHGRQGGGLARTGRTGHQDQPARLLAESLHDWR